MQNINNGTFTLASVALNIYNGATDGDATQLAAKLTFADAFTAAIAPASYITTVRSVFSSGGIPG